MKELAYISTSRGLVFDDDVLSILQVSRRRNARIGLTGLLCYDGHTFFQLLEGPEEAVDRLYSAILDDARHCDVRLVADGIIHERSFASWSMDYRRIDTRLETLGLVSADGHVRIDREGRVGPGLARLFAA